MTELKPVIAGSPEASSGARYALLLLRLAWLLPLTAGAAGYALVLLLSLRFSWFHPLSLLPQAVVTWLLFLGVRRGWRNNGPVLRGEKAVSAGEILRQVLMILLVVVIPLGVIVPRAIDLQNYALDGANKGGLSTVRYALEESYKSSGKYPASAAELAAVLDNGAYPLLWGVKFSRAAHAPTNAAFDYPDGQPRDSGGWGFVPGAEGAPPKVFIDCTHTDNRGQLWSAL